MLCIDLEQKKQGKMVSLVAVEYGQLAAEIPCKASLCNSFKTFGLSTYFERTIACDKISHLSRALTLF